jgi:hypothetical protein
MTMDNRRLSLGDAVETREGLRIETPILSNDFAVHL